MCHDISTTSPVVVAVATQFVVYIGLNFWYIFSIQWQKSVVPNNTTPILAVVVVDGGGGVAKYYR
jgi:hypothetical protein